MDAEDGRTKFRGHRPCQELDVNMRLLTALAALSALLPADVRAEDGPTNFVVVSCDNLGYGDIEPFGSTLHRTPHLNRMAKEGRCLTHFCVTAGVCTPSRASLMTGCYAQRIGLHTNERDGWVLRPVSPYGLNPGETTIAEVLRAGGYATAIIGKWHLGDQPEFLPTRHGFDWFFGVPYSDDMTERIWDKDGSQWPPLPLMENEEVIEAPCDRRGLTKRYTEKALEWITAHREEPFFLYLPQAMPGSTRTPFTSAEFRGVSRNGSWGDSIEELDWSIGQILDRLTELDLAEDTLVIWTSDNGAPINAAPEDLSRGSNRPLHGRGYTTSEGAFRVPTIVWQPGAVPAGTTCDALTTTMDLLPTFAGLAGTTKAVPEAIDGHDIRDVLYGTEDSPSPYKFFCYYDQDQLQAIRSGRWKLFLPVEPRRRHPHFDASSKRVPLLFDVVSDVSCEENVAAANPSVVARLTAFAELAREDLGDLGRPGKGQRPAGRVAAPMAQQKKPKALEVIEGTRGGRHWVDSKTASAMPAEQSLRALKVEDGFRVELVASEPLVMDPVAIAFDDRGHMFVSEFSDYPVGAKDGQPPLSRVVCLLDTDADGRMDERHVFADHLDFAHSLMPFRDGLLVGARTKVLFLKDTDGDMRADVREVMFDGFTPAHPQMQIGNPRWGIDNWVYLNYAPGNVSSSEKPDERVTLPRRDMRFHPQTLAFESDSGMGQFGNTIDRWGRRYYCTNRNPIITTLLTPSEVAHNPFAPRSAAFYDVGRAGGDTRVYPRVDMKSNYLSHAGTHTSACGVTAYTGGLFGDSMRESVFVCEPIGHLVTRSVVSSDQVRLVAQKAEPQADFLTSTDTWFRPSSLTNGPDGALYLADMYRLWVEHPRFLPAEIAEQLDWRAGDDLGRIYRIVPADSSIDQDFRPPETDEDCVRLLTSRHGWRRMLGQRRLVERQATNQQASIRRLLQESASAETRHHALWTLDGLADVTVGDLLLAMQDSHPIVRASGARLSLPHIDNELVFDALRRLVDDSDAGVRFRLAIALGHSSNPEATTLLTRLAVSPGDITQQLDGLFTATQGREVKMLQSLLARRDVVVDSSGDNVALIRGLSYGIGRRAAINELQTVMSLVGDRPQSDSSRAALMWWQSAVVAGLAEGLPQSRGSLGRVTLASLLSDPPDRLRVDSARLRAALQDSLATISEESVALSDRVAAAGFLAWLPLSQTRSTFEELLTSSQGAAIQGAAVAALIRIGTPDSATLLIDRWDELTPSARVEALMFLLRGTATTRLTLAAMQSGQLSSSALSIDQRVRLLKHRDSEISDLAGKLFGGAVAADREKVTREYRVAVELAGDDQNGAKVFQRVCANCHRLNGGGHQVGPDLTDAMNRSRLALLHDILDPNSKVEPRFSAYTVVTRDGRTWSGLVATETEDSVELKMAGGKSTVIARDTIDTAIPSSRSLMPEGVEKDVTVQQMADLLSYLKSVRKRR